MPIVAHGKTRHVALAALLAVACAAAISCSQSPEERIRARIDEAVATGENRELAKLKSFVSPEYSDSRQLDRRELLGMVALQLRGADSVHCYARTREVRLTGPGRAEASVLLAVADLPITDVRALERLRAELLIVDLGFVEESGDWKVVTAEWRTASLREFLN